MEDLPLSDLLRQAIIKTDNQLLVLSDSSWQDCPDTGRIIGSFIVFYKVVPIDHCTHGPGQVAKSSSESEYNSSCTAGMALENFRMLNN